MRASGVSAAGQAGPRGPRRDERWLAGVWDKQSFERRQLRTTLGLAFKVVFPGMCTGGAGPDFRDAILALPDGSLLRGDVELHLESSGWRQHGHDRDPAYDRVLLHVVLEDDVPAHNSRGEPVLTLELAGRLKPRRLAEPKGMLAAPGRARPELAGSASPDELPHPTLSSHEPPGTLRRAVIEPVPLNGPAGSAEPLASASRDCGRPAGASPAWAMYAQAAYNTPASAGPALLERVGAWPGSALTG